MEKNKIGLVTIIDYNNYGNRLQNYACNYVVTNLGYEVITVKEKYTNLIEDIKRYIKLLLNYKGSWKKSKRKQSMKKFSKNLKMKKLNKIIKDKKFSGIFIVGSDQVWNYNFNTTTDLHFLKGVDVNKKISFSSSFGVSTIREELKEKYRNCLENFDYLSVREDAGKKIIENLLDRKDVEVLIDPTMMLTAEEWNKIIKKPEILKTKKYILNYFLGNLSIERRKEIERVAKENNCEIINILDKNSPFYKCGPSEFLYLEKNAFLVCTDSFHSSIFAILFNTPFLVFDRKQKNLTSMNSRIETLLSKFQLENRKYKGKIETKDLKTDYTEAYKILDIERKKANEFLEIALDIKEKCE